MRADLIEVVQAAGFEPDEFEVVAEAPLIDDLPAIIAGTFRGHNAAIRAFDASTEPGHPHWHATGFVSRHPGLALDCLTFEERERLRAEKLTPTGFDKPVGQAAVIGANPVAFDPSANNPSPDPEQAVPYAPPVIPVRQEVVALDGVPYAPPLPESGEVIDTTAVELPDAQGVQVANAQCGGPNCIAFDGPEGVQVTHDPNTCPESAEADRG